MQTQSRPIQHVETPEGPQHRRRLVVALAAAVSIIAVSAATWALLGGGESDAVGSPLSVVQALEDATISGNQAAERTFYADDAILQVLIPGDQIEVRLGDPVTGDNSLSDWDADGVITSFDAVLHDGARVYAAGVTDLLVCSQSDATTVVCDEVLEGSPFLESVGEHIVTQTFTVVDGRIARHVVDMTANSAAPFGEAELTAYHTWVESNRPAQAGELFDVSGELNMSPETVETHRQLIAEWQVQG